MTTQLHSFVTEVTLDSASQAVIPHEVGVIPSAVLVQPSGPGQLVSVNPASYTDTTFVARFNWHDGTRFKAGTKLAVTVLVTYEGPDEPEATILLTSSDPKATWIDPTDQNVRINNEVWNTAEAGPQELTVYSSRSFSVRSTQPKPGANPHSVKSYPDIQYLFPNRPISSFTKISSTFGHYAPSGGEWNAAYDIWLGGLGSKSTAEVMIWTDHRYPGPLPPANAVKSDTVKLNGITYTSWTRKNSNGGDYIALVAQQTGSEGVVDILGVFKYLMTIGWISKDSTLAAIDYGIEISSTLGVPAIFSASADLTAI